MGSYFLIVGLFLLATTERKAYGATFNFVNNCGYTVWPGVLSNAGWPLLGEGGFQLQPGQSIGLSAPSGWSGRMWARTGCSFSASGEGICASGDCGGKLQCNGAGAATPATLAEFTLAGANSASSNDFYDVSLVDGYNLPIAIYPHGGTGTCAVAGCNSDLNANCPAELQIMDNNQVIACKSACDAFGSPQYCCQGMYANPNTCAPSHYSQIFKSACPRAYSYAYDDPTSTFTCGGTDYTIAFCASSYSSQKSSNGLQPPGDVVAGRSAWSSNPNIAATISRPRPLLSGVLILISIFISSWLF